MRIETCEIAEIRITDKFYQDLEKVPMDVRKRFNNLIRIMQEGRRLPNSFHAHLSGTSDSMWIGYLNRDRVHWRILFEQDNNNPVTLVLLRLVKHRDMDFILKDDY